MDNLPPAELPVMEVMAQLKRALADSPSAVLIAPPGAGKTTRVPLELLDQPWLGAGRIIMLEPRRLAARASARRMAQTLSEDVGKTIGYRMRMDNRVSAGTCVEIVTEGVFQHMILDDPELQGVGCVIFDEFHERSLDADFGLALAIDVQQALRPDLRLLVMSATLDGARVSALLGDCPVLESAGRMYPVDIRHADRRGDLRLEDQVASSIREMVASEEGSILVFLPGQGEIRRTQERLEGRLPANCFVVPLFGAMDIADQDEAIRPAPPGQRKIVLATAIAQTSITIDGVRIVIDAGLSRQAVHEPALGISRLETVRVSQATADQRAGRAGRTAPGIALRLWRKEQTAALAAFDTPEILAADLSRFVLDCLSWGATDPSQLALLDRPPAAAWSEAQAMLARIGALDDSGHVTAFGNNIRHMPLPVRDAAMVARATGRVQAEHRALLAIVLGERGLGGTSVDLDARLDRVKSTNGVREKKARDFARRLTSGIADGRSDTANEPAAVMLADGYGDRIAKARTGRPGHFIMANGRGAVMDETDPLVQAEFLVIADMTGSAASARILAAARLDASALEIVAAGAITESVIHRFDPQTSGLTARQERNLGAIILQSAPRKVMLGETATQALVDAVRAHGLGILPWSDTTEALRRRLAWLHVTMGDRWPSVDDHALVSRLEEWLAPYLAGKTALRQLDDNAMRHALMGLVPYELHTHLDHLAPARFEVPTGSSLALDYPVDGSFPILSVRVQEVFGLGVHPSIAAGKVPLTLELLSPAHRPIQKTQDLPNFWRGSWKDVRADMRGRYPRHEWPEDPANAHPTRRAKPRK